jgi:hypothetical protein
MRALLALAMMLTACASTGATPAGAVPPALLERAAAGPLRVVVQLRVPGDTSPARIASVKQSLLARIAATPHRVLRDLPGFPLLALEASLDTLLVLNTAPEVSSVQAETFDRPLR